jgi:hypothetical protein
MTDPRGVCAKRAEDLSPGIPYVRGWSDGRAGADALAEQLRFAGLAAEFPGLQADVNVSGEGLVRLGAIRPATAVRLAGLLAAGLAADLMGQLTREARSDAAEADPVNE